MKTTGFATCHGEYDQFFKPFIPRHPALKPARAVRGSTGRSKIAESTSRPFVYGLVELHAPRQWEIVSGRKRRVEARRRIAGTEEGAGGGEEKKLLNSVVMEAGCRCRRVGEGKVVGFDILVIDKPVVCGLKLYSDIHTSLWLLISSVWSHENPQYAATFMKLPINSEMANLPPRHLPHLPFLNPPPGPPNIQHTLYPPSSPSPPRPALQTNANASPESPLPALPPPPGAPPNPLHTRLSIENFDPVTFSSVASRDRFARRRNALCADELLGRNRGRGRGVMYRVTSGTERGLQCRTL